MQFSNLLDDTFRNQPDKPRVVEVSDPAAIEAIQRNSLHDPIGGNFGGAWYAYAWSLERWRKARAGSYGSESRS